MSILEPYILAFICEHPVFTLAQMTQWMTPRIAVTSEDVYRGLYRLARRGIVTYAYKDGKYRILWRRGQR
ncbi:MAG: hypothetical protein F9B45_30720 [Phycisphaera sp. RhM]|nr:hypothetical protein [Phycisphaera sp. RhM]